MTLATEQAESALVGRLFLDTRQIPVVSGILKPEDFGVEAYGDYYRAMVALHAENKPIDLVTLKSALGAESIDIDPLELTAGHRGPVEEYAALIVKAAQRRRVIAELDYVRDLAASGEGDIMGALEKAVSTILERTPSDIVDPGTTAKGYMEALLKRSQGNDPGLTWGIPGMDDILLPARRGRLCLLAARPSVGKTAMAESIADHWARQGRGPILFVSLEMDREELMDRAMARDTGIPSEAISRGHLSKEQLEVVMDAAALRGAGAVHYLDEGSITTSRIKSAAAKLKMQGDGTLGGIIVDYTQLLEDPGNGGNDNSRVAAISRALKQTARSMGCPVLAMSQLNREIEKEKRKPRLSDLRDSGALEQDGDIVMIMTGRLDEPQRTVYVMKQRQGKSGEFHVRFDGNHQTWHEPGPWQLPDAEEDVWGKAALGGEEDDDQEPKRW